MAYKYSTREGGYKHDLDTTWDSDSLEYMAEDAAQDFYDNQDGWEASWPQDIEVFEDDKSLGKFSVELEHEPTFSAIEL